MKRLQGGSPELFQWTIIAFTVLIVATLTVNAIRLQATTRDLARKVEVLQVGQQTMPPKGVPVPPAGIVANSNANENTNTPAVAVLVAPNVVGIPGTQATITVPGDWKLDTTNGLLAFVYGHSYLTVHSTNIGDQDLQQWFNKQYPMTDFVKDRVADGVKAGFAVTGSDLLVTGPNQVKIAGNLAMDLTISYLKQFDPENPSVQTQRFVAVRYGGDAYIFELTMLTAEKEMVTPIFDQVLSSLSIAR